MPQLNKGGKYVFGWSLIREDGSIHFPPMAICEYDLAADDRIIIFTGSRITGGFCVTNNRMLLSSKLKHSSLHPFHKTPVFPADDLYMLESSLSKEYFQICWRIDHHPRNSFHPDPTLFLIC